MFITSLKFNKILRLHFVSSHHFINSFLLDLLIKFIDRKIPMYEGLETKNTGYLKIV